MHGCRCTHVTKLGLVIPLFGCLLWAHGAEEWEYVCYHNVHWLAMRRWVIYDASVMKGAPNSEYMSLAPSWASTKLRHPHCGHLKWSMFGGTMESNNRSNLLRLETAFPTSKTCLVNFGLKCHTYRPKSLLYPKWYRYVCTVKSDVRIYRVSQQVSELGLVDLEFSWSNLCLFLVGLMEIGRTCRTRGQVGRTSKI